jgi:hypothetical protein
MKIEYNNPMVVMAAAIPQWKTHNTSQKPGIMPWPPQQMRSNPPSATTSPSKSLQPKTEIKTQDEAPMKIQDGSSSLSS